MAVGGCRAKGRMATDGHRAAGRMAADGMAVDGQVVALHLLRRKQHLGWSPRQPMCQRCRPQRFAVETHPSRPSVADLALEPLPVELPPAEPLSIEPLPLLVEPLPVQPPVELPAPPPPPPLPPLPLPLPLPPLLLPLSARLLRMPDTRPPLGQS